MSSMLTDRMRDRKTYSLPPSLNPPREQTGPVFLATHSLSDLRHWPSDRLRLLGPLHFPLGYSQHSDRYEVRLWGEILANIARAISDCDVLTLIGGQSVSSELETIQTLFHHHTRKPVD